MSYFKFLCFPDLIPKIIHHLQLNKQNFLEQNLEPFIFPFDLDLLQFNLDQIIAQKWLQAQLPTHNNFDTWKGEAH